MVQAVLKVGDLPDSPLDAAARFHAHYLPLARAALGDGRDLALLFGPAGKPHAGWRLSAVQELAREAAPHRVNAVAGEDEDAIAETLRWLDNAPGVTGQILQVDGKNGQKG
ncbi:hypothetical protein WYH_01271 [Croceibacterium atlanticum]|uniref:Short chain dehydrogenase-like proteobacteria domain-containing protein n=1 Tax=Croceibacterium atlanticum TaxID=1267766 RepID=A0A0F7KT27_9SPHN|nr:hypothetical protein [Croceibacterium atlanticum]AKH42316.1 hypothetical protein WYH_01271 [Croceibacterium atlanticum]